VRQDNEIPGELSQAPLDVLLARRLIAWLPAPPLRPNHITTLGLITGLSSAWLYAGGDPVRANWAGALFMLTLFLDHVDGELARCSGTSSIAGHYYDLAVDLLIKSALFFGIGLGLSRGSLGVTALLLGLVVGASILAIFLLRHLSVRRSGSQALRQPAVPGFEIEDVLYLLGPLTWSGWLQPFLIVAGVGAPVFALWTLWRLLRDSSGGCNKGEHRAI